MVRILPVLLVILLVPGLASAAEYLVVVSEDGTVQDVINGANFAASMKGSVGVTFQSQSPDELQEDLDETLVVFLEGDEANILPGTLPEFDRVVDNAEVYLEREGFEVTVGAAPARDSRSERDSGGDPEPQELPEIDDEVVVEAEISDPLPVQGDSPPQELETTRAGVVDDPVKDNPPNVFVRVWRWFAGIFS